MFAKWKLYFKSKMKDEEWGFDMVLLWQAVLNEFNITEDELTAGTTKACFARELKGWPPTTATDFINVIRGDVVSEYPTTLVAFTTACQNCGMRGDIKRKWGHVVVLTTANRIGWGKLASASDGFFKTFGQVYEQVIAEHQAGADFTVAEDKRIEAPKHEPVQAGSDADKKISEQLAQLRRVAV